MTFDSLWAEISTHVPRLLAAFPVACAVILVGLIANAIIRRSLRLLAQRTSLTPADVMPVQKVARITVASITIVVVLGVFGFELGGIWSVLSTILAMVAIGFVAVWSILSNTSATVIILLLRPFHVGDHIELPSEKVEGQVVDMNFFFTTLRIDERTTHLVPNNLFFQKVITRTAGNGSITLAQQLSSKIPANVAPVLPTPKPDKEAGDSPVSASEDFAAKSVPDPATMQPDTGDDGGDSPGRR